MFDDAIPLDEIVDRIVIPTLVTFDSVHAKTFPGSHSKYLAAIQEEIAEYHTIFSALTDLKIEIKLIYVPLGDKRTLCSDFVKRLEAFQ